MRASAFANPFALASAVSGEVKTAWLGVRVLGPLHHPLRLIEQTNLLDLLTRGRSLLILADAGSAEQYASFGVPEPANGQLHELVDAIDYAWNWQYEEDGPPMQLSSGRYSAQMAGRIMPAPFRTPHPLVAREASTDEAVLDAARRGWAVHLRCESLDRTRELADQYRRALAAANHPAATAQVCIDRLAAALEVRPATTQRGDRGAGSSGRGRSAPRSRLRHAVRGHRRACRSTARRERAVTMQFGLYLTPQVEGPDEDAPSIDTIVEHAHQGDEAGFATVYLTEHHFDNYNAYCDPILMGARLSPYLERAWMSYSVVLLPLAHPFRMVEDFNTIDQLMQGRCIFGLGSAGGGLIMTDGLGRTRPSASRNASEHVIEVMLQAWRFQSRRPAAGRRDRLRPRPPGAADRAQSVPTPAPAAGARNQRRGDHREVRPHGVARHVRPRRRARGRAVRHALHQRARSG